MAALIKDRRGIFFTLLAIVILSLFLLSVVFISSSTRDTSVQERVESLDSFVFSVEEDLPRQLFVSGFRTIFLIEENMITSGSYVSDVGSVFNESFFNGTFMGANNELLTKTAFLGIQNSLDARADMINAEIALTNPTLIVTQDGPWNVKMILDADLFVEDAAKEVSWNKTIQVVSYIPIQTFDDPIYLVNTNGLIGNKIVKSPYVSFASITNLSDHLTKGYYIASDDAPSFLQRLEGDLNANPNGVESLVNLDKLSGQGINVHEKSLIDYEYFSSTNPSFCSVQESGLPGWFRIANYKAGEYGVTCA